jgi:hypothetical protein
MKPTKVYIVMEDGPDGGGGVLAVFYSKPKAEAYEKAHHVEPHPTAIMGNETMVEEHDIQDWQEEPPTPKPAPMSLGHYDHYDREAG